MWVGMCVGAQKRACVHACMQVCMYVCICVCVGGGWGLSECISHVHVCMSMSL